VLGGQAAARNHEGDVTLRKGDPHARSDERALSGLETHRLRRRQIRSRVAGVRVDGSRGGDNGHVDGIGHPTRVMQMGRCSIRDANTYRERLSPSLWALVAAAVCGPMAALVLAPIDETAALIAGAVVGIGVVAALIALSPTVEIRDGILHAGAAHIDAAFLGEPVAVTGEDARQARGARLDGRSWMLLRGGIDGVVTVPVTDPDDPTPAWVISTRTPDRLAAAIRRAQVRPRTPRR
jgi:hypothetical protein